MGINGNQWLRFGDQSFFRSEKMWTWEPKNVAAKTSERVGKTRNKMCQIFRAYGRALYIHIIQFLEPHKITVFVIKRFIM